MTLDDFERQARDRINRTYDERILQIQAERREALRRLEIEIADAHRHMASQRIEDDDPE